MEYTIMITVDSEAGVFVATSPDIKGLVLEDELLKSLKARVEAAVPELLVLNHQEPAEGLHYEYEYKNKPVGTGFAVPTIGVIHPKGSKVRKNSDGTITIVPPEDTPSEKEKESKDEAE